MESPEWKIFCKQIQKVALSCNLKKESFCILYRLCDICGIVMEYRQL